MLPSEDNQKSFDINYEKGGASYMGGVKYSKEEMRVLMALALIKHLYKTGRISEKMYLSICKEYEKVVDKKVLL